MGDDLGKLASEVDEKLCILEMMLDGLVQELGAETLFLDDEVLKATVESLITESRLADEFKIAHGQRSQISDVAKAGDLESDVAALVTQKEELVRHPFDMHWSVVVGRVRAGRTQIINDAAMRAAAILETFGEVTREQVDTVFDKSLRLSLRHRIAQAIREK